MDIVGVMDGDRFGDANVVRVVVIAKVGKGRVSGIGERELAKLTAYQGCPS